MRRPDRTMVALVLGVVLALVAVACYQVWASQVQDRTETKIVRSTSSCAQVDRLYSSLSRLMADDLTFTPREVAAMRQQRVERLHAQGCKT